MLNKNIFLALITIFTYLNFITCKTETNLTTKIEDAVFSASSEEEDDFRSIIQFVIDKYLALDRKQHKDFVKDFMCDGCNCDDFYFLTDSVPVKIIICKGHAKQMDVWKKLFSNNKKSNYTCEKTKESPQLINNGLTSGWAQWIDISNSWNIVVIGAFYKYFYFYNSDHYKDESVVKKCGCKILKNATTEYMEICLCKTHFKALKDWEKQIFDLSAQEG